MSPSRQFTVAGAVCLVVGSLAVFVQYLVTPISGDMSASELVAKAADHHKALGWALALDVPAMLVIPAVIFVGYLAGSRTSTLAGIATALCLVPAIGGVVLFANDAVVYEAAKLSDRHSAATIVHGFENNAMIATVSGIYLLTHLIGFILLGIALHRRGAVPVWAAIAIAIWPIAEMVGYATGAKAVAAVGYGLLAIGYVVCAATLLGARSTNVMPTTASLGQNQPA